MNENNAITLPILLYGYRLPSLNQTQMAHWSRVRKEKKRAIEHLMAGTVGQHGHIPQFRGTVHIQIIRLIGRKGRKMDVDNLHGSVKPLIDAMRAQKVSSRGSKQGGLGLIADDGEQDITLDVQQHRIEEKAYLIREYELERWMEGKATSALVVLKGLLA